MTQRSSITYAGITWYYSLPPSFWINSAPGKVMTGQAGANNALYDPGGKTLVGGGGGGDNTFYLAAGDQAVAGVGDGVDTLITYWGDVVLPVGFANGVLTHSGSIKGNAGNNILTATGAGSHTFNAGTGNDVMIGAAGSADRFIITQGDGTDVIVGFEHKIDVVQLNGFSVFSGPQGFAKVQTAMTQIGNDVSLNLGGGETLLFAGTTKAQFVAADFALPSGVQGWTKTFDDEFDTFSASSAGFGVNWWAQTGTLASNKEAENYVNNTGVGGPFSLSNGILAITATPVSSAPGLPYTSGEITTARSFAQTYGYFEMSAKLPAGQGMWPAFWLLPANGTWPPELDVMEALGNNPTTIYATTHSGIGGPNVTNGLTIGVDNTTTGFHTYAVDWEPDIITYYFDGNNIGSVPTPADMNQPMYMLINLAVGGVGSWPGAAAGETASMLVDYVRAYASPTAVQPALVFSNSGRSIVKGSGNFSITGTGNYGWITLGAGNQTVRLTAATGTSQASGNTITTGNGNQSISVAGSGNVITTGTGISTISAGTNNAVVTIGGSPLGTSVVTVAGYQSVVTAKGNGNVNVTATVTGTVGGAKITLKDGNHLINLGGSGNNVTVGVGTSVINAGIGQAVVHAGGGADTITVTGKNNLLDAGPGINFLNGGSGNDTFVLNAAGQGLDTITGFQSAIHDVLDLTRALAGFPLTANLSNVGQFLSAQTRGTATAIMITPSGGGAVQAVALLMGVNVSMSTLLSNNNIMMGGHLI